MAQLGRGERGPVDHMVRTDRVEDENCVRANAAKLNNGVWLSLVERCVRDAEVAGSNPVTPIKIRAMHLVHISCFIPPDCM